MVGASYFEWSTFMVLEQQKGRNTEENLKETLVALVRRLQKALRLMKMANRFLCQWFLL